MNTPRYWLASFALLLAGFATFAALYDVQPLLPALARQFRDPTYFVKRELPSSARSVPVGARASATA